ncbi:YjjG family noncanonical pyrimidine nucleotidase [Bacillus massiliigorillae]|uniref:YjjG family noncanonical pyrimidine nucleotidase n=1 Tax=Bacillus massiliigorillae TaxID=1243664 RepID=UPI0005AA50C7|nr:YjjG family noncanonical pyrimidine nucleotidase [Bacillus massiliigorillae]
MKYEVILFDVDDTLLDFGISQQNALQHTFMAFSLPTGMTDYAPLYKEISNGLWRELEQGRITLSELKVERFRRLFEARQLEIDADAFNNMYLDSLGKQIHPLPGAIELCERLMDYRLAVITNGFTDVQKARFSHPPFDHTFEQLIISEETGFQKPQIEIFDYAFAKLHITDKSKVLMVGDSLTSDVQGGINYGIDTCWFNPHGKENTLGITPTYEIRDLMDVLSIVGETRNNNIYANKIV